MQRREGTGGQLPWASIGHHFQLSSHSPIPTAPKISKWTAEALERLDQEREESREKVEALYARCGFLGEQGGWALAWAPTEQALAGLWQPCARQHARRGYRPKAEPPCPSLQPLPGSTLVSGPCQQQQVRDRRGVRRGRCVRGRLAGPGVARAPASPLGWPRYAPAHTTYM